MIHQLGRRLVAEVTPGAIRDVRPRLLYMSPDRRALLIDLDAASKRWALSIFLEEPRPRCRSWNLVAMAGTTDETLRADPKLVARTEVRIALPCVQGVWYVATDGPARYSARLFAVCQEDR